jgi:chromosome partitioning protein
VRFAEAPAVGHSIMKTARSTPGAIAYRELARTLVGLPPESAPAVATPTPASAFGAAHQ